jgi:ABC-2 type transport system ATP-binding protein
MASSLEVRRLAKRFRGIVAVDNISFVARAGEITGYLGPNGSGKSTTMKIIAGLLQPTSGEIAFDGLPIQRDLEGWKRRFGYVPEEPHLYSHLSGLEYLTMVRQLRDLPPGKSGEKIDALLEAFGLHSDRHVPISSYSKGMRQKVLLAAALLHDPDFVMLDEPFSGLDVTMSLVLRGLIQELARRGKTILFSSHELDTVERVSSRIVIIHRGRLVADDSIDNLRNLASAPSLESIFSQLTAAHDVEAVSRRIAEIVSA